MRRALCFVVVLVSARAFAQEPPPTSTVVQHVVFTSSISGHFAEPRCQDGVSFAPAPFAPYAASLAAAAAAPASFAFDTGGLFEPHGVGRFALEREPAILVELVRGLGYDALAFSSKDLQTSRAPLERVARALAAGGIPLVASNLRCTGTAVALCESLDDASDPVRLTTSDGERIALISLIDPAVLSHVAAENKRDLALEPLAEAIHRRVLEARTAGATLVLVSVDNGSGARAAGEAIALAESLSEADRPDLLVAARAGRDLLYARPASFQPPIASAPPGAAATVEVRRRSDLVGFEMLVQPLLPSPAVSPALEAFVAETGPDYCSAHGAPLAGGRLATPIDRAGVLDLTGGAMRAAADAEIAILNLPMIADGFARPAGHVLTSSDVQVALQFDEPIVVAEVDAAWLAAAARRNATRTDVRMIGLTIANPGASNEAITINGRPLDTRGRYKVAVPRFLATGGDEVLVAGPDWDAVGDEVTVRSSLYSLLRPARTIDPRLALPNPAERLEWSFAFASDASFGSSRVENPGMYTDTQFDRADSVAYGTENKLNLIARSTRLAWENEGIVRYRSTRNLGGPRAESDDLISYRTTFAYHQPRVRHPDWWMPEPYAETYAETEFTVPAMNQYRHFLVRPTLGARFTLTSVLTLKLQAGGAFELFDRNVDPSPGVGGVLTLATWKFFETGPRNGTLGATFDWFLSGLGVEPRHTMRGNLDVALQINHVLGISFTGTLFAVNTPSTRLSYVLNSTANLRLRWFVRTQR